MTAAIAELPKTKTVAALPALKPTQYPTQDVPVHLIVRSETNRVPDVDDDFIESIRGGVRSAVLLRPIKATQEHTVVWMPLYAGKVKVGDTLYKLVYGERRWIAAKKAGHTHIPAVIRELTDTQALEIQIEENEQRDDYKIMERASAYAHLKAQYMLDHKGEKGFTEEKCMELIAHTCKSDKIKGRTVQQIIALGKLHTFCQAALNQGEMEASHGYEICRRPEEDQLALLKWLRKETQHGQGDIPSVRRLKLEIRNMDIAAEDKRRQEKLFKDPQPGTSTTPVPTVDDQLYGRALEVVREAKLHRMNDPLFLGRNLKIEPAAAHQLFVRLEKEGIVTPRDSNSERSYVFPKADAAAQTSAPTEDKKIANAITTYKPPTKAQIKAEEQHREKEEKARKVRMEKNRIAALIDKKYNAAFFSSLATKSHVCSRFLTHVVPMLLFEMWEQNDIPLEGFAQNLMGWPAPKNGATYDYNEIKANSQRHTRKFTGNLLAALLITIHLPPPEAARMAKYFGVDVKKLRQRAALQVKQEERDAKKKAVAAK